jgi:hypothetical protein
MEPTSEAIYERARRLANMAMRTVALQCRRLRSHEPEDSTFILRRWADFELLVVALTRLRRAANIAKAVPEISEKLAVAICSFDASLPGVKLQRDVAEHIDEYAVDAMRRHHKAVEQKQVEVGILNDDSWEWLGCKLSIDEALSKSEALFAAIQSLGSHFTPHSS